MRRQIYTLGLLFTVGLSYGQTAGTNNVFYVKQGASTATSAGNSWANAHGDLGAVIAKAKSNAVTAKIYVAKGTYAPNRNNNYETKNANDKTRTFRIPDKVTVYGGFNPDSGILTEDQRDFSKANETILTGSYNNAAYYYHVVVLQGNESGALDGVSITKGNANNTGTSGSMNQGFGGAVHVQNGTLQIRNSRVYDNYAKDRGGALYVEKDNAKLYVINSELFNNISDGDGSAIFINNKAFSYVINSTVVKNTSNVGNNGGALHVKDGGNFYVYNSILWNNKRSGNTITGMSGGVATDFIMRNSIVNDNTDNYYGEQFNNRVYHDYPQFADFAGNDFSLKNTSYALGKGSVNFLDNNGGAGTRDLKGNPRKTGTTIDIGAYQHQNPLLLKYAVYIDPKANGKGNGTTWTAAGTSLADVLQLINIRTRNSSKLIPGSTTAYQDYFTGITIHVAKGEHKPEYDASNYDLASDNTKASFLLSKDVKIYGSFDPENNVTTVEGRNMKVSYSELSGDNKSNHVVIAAGANSTGAELDGFLISGGHAAGGNNTTVNGQSLNPNFGGGLIIQDSKIKARKLIFTNNKAAERGNAIYVEKSGGELTLSNSLLYSNEPTSNSTTLEGSAIYLNDNAVAKIVNTTVSKNTSKSGIGGALHVKAGGKFYIYNTIAWDNKNTSDKLLNLTGGSSNSTNFEVYNSIVNADSNPDGEDGNGHNNGDNGGKINFTSFNPLFTNPATNDYTLQQLSSAINQGHNNNYIANGGAISDLDMYANSRITDNTIDIGAFEHTNPIKPDATNTLYVNKNANGLGDGSNWTNAFKELADALKWANQQNSFGGFTQANPLKIKVAGGTYAPQYSPVDLEQGTVEAARSFVMVKNVHVSGSYDPNSDKQTGVDSAYKSILAGKSNNHLVIAAGDASNNSLLENFQIQNAVANAAGSITVNGNSINGDKGAGVYVTTDDANKPVKLTLKNIIATNNKANERGGFLYADKKGSSVYVINTLAYNNSVTNGQEGGSVAFSNNEAKVFVVNSTITDNKSNNANGGAFHVADHGTFDVYNSIVWNNKNKSNANANLTGGVDANFVVSNSIMNKDGNNGTDDHNNGDNGGKINFLVHDPNFVDPINNNYNLDPTDANPAIDQGNSDNYLQFGNGFTKTGDMDVFGNPRIFEKLDMGALESQSVSAIKPGINNTLYIKKGATGNGSEWGNEVGELADALKWAKERIDLGGKLTIKVAKGTYFPKYNAVDFNKYSEEVDKTFLMVKNVHILGGYDPSNNKMNDNERNLKTAPTTLSGNDKSYHVVVSAGDKDSDVNIYSKLDGFIITGGNAKGLNSTTINNEGISQHYGAGIYADNTRLKVHGSIFRNNKSITGTDGKYGRAGAFYAEGNSDIVLSNSLVYDNSVDGEGSATFANDDNTTFKIVNTTITDNKTTSGNSTGAVHMANGADYFIQNSIIWNNKNKNGNANLTGGNANDGGWNVNNSIINRKSNLVEDGDGHNDGENGGKINFKSYDPKFVNAAAKNYALQPTSSAIKTGNKNFYLAIGDANDLDTYGNTRVKETSVDIGAIESQISIAENPAALYVDANVSNSNQTGSSWANAMTNLADALQWVSRVNNNYTAENPLKIYVAKGTQKPMYSFNTKTYRNAQGRPSNDEDNHNIDSDFEVDVNNESKNHAFFIPNNVKVYGNYNPSTGMLNEGNKPSETILSGASNKSRHIIVTSKSNGKAVVATLENVIIQDADANGSGDLNGINHNYGGGVYAEDATLNLKNVIVKNNKSNERGAGLYAEMNAIINITNSILYNNVSNGDGSAMYSNDYALINVLNSTVVNNTSKTDENGGALHVKANGKFDVRNSILWNNKRNNGVITNLTGGNEDYFNVANTVMNAGSTPHLSNNINYFTFDPQFVDVDNNDVRLQEESEAIDKGNNQDYDKNGNDSSTDLDAFGNKRLVNLIIDLGAIEHFKDSTLSTGNTNSHKATKLYPNPTTGIFVIDSPELETVAIYNIAGQFIKTLNLKVGKNQIDITGLTPGLYIIKAKNSSHKIIKN